MSLKVAYIGHATTLIEWDGLKILTDPVFSSRILFFKRLQPLPFDPAQLPKLDAILLSHAHYDHLDLFSYKYIPSDVPILIPEGMSKAIKGLVNNPIIELSTWSRFSLAQGSGVCAVPAKHRGGRFLFPYRYRTCHGYVISHGSEHIYFAGDTAYDNHFARIRSLFPIKLALLPHAVIKAIGTIKYKHMDWEGFSKAWEDLGRPDVIPIHWGTFFKFCNSPEFFKKAFEKQTQQNSAAKETKTKNINQLQLLRLKILIRSPEMFGRVSLMQFQLLRLKICENFIFSPRILLRYPDHFNAIRRYPRREGGATDCC